MSQLSICKNQKETSFLHRMRLVTIKMINEIKLITSGRLLNLFIYFLCWKKIWEIVPEEILRCFRLQNMEITSEYSSPLLTKMLQNYERVNRSGRNLNIHTLKLIKEQSHERKGKLPVKWKHLSDICPH